MTDDYEPTVTNYSRVEEIFKEFLRQRAQLKELVPALGWQGFGGLLSDYGIVQACKVFDLILTPERQGQNALTRHGESVEIKVVMKSTSVSFRGTTTLLLVVRVTEDAEVEEVYYGPTKPLKMDKCFSEKEKRYTLSLQAIQKIQERSKRPPLAKWLQPDLD